MKLFNIEIDGSDYCFFIKITDSFGTAYTGSITKNVKPLPEYIADCVTKAIKNLPCRAELGFSESPSLMPEAVANAIKQAHAT